MKLEIQQLDEVNWLGKIGTKKVCEFNYFLDSDGLFWINNISTIYGYQKKGFGSEMIQAAIKVYKKIYVSSAKKSEFNGMEKIEGDSKYTNSVTYKSSELKKFVDKLIEKGIFDKDCEQNPYKKG